MMNINAKVILKFVCLMGVWSTVLIGLMKLHTNHGTAQMDEEGPGGVKSGRLLLQKETRFFQEATSTTTEKFMPLDVLIDNRTRKSTTNDHCTRSVACAMLLKSALEIELLLVIGACPVFEIGMHAGRDLWVT